MPGAIDILNMMCNCLFEIFGLGADLSLSLFLSFISFGGAFLTSLSTALTQADSSSEIK